MPVSFIGSEATAFDTVNVEEVTSAGTFRSANSRNSVSMDGNEVMYAEWDTAVSEGWIHFVMNGLLDNDGTDFVLLVTDSSDANLFAITTPAVDTIRFSYWNGSAWVQIGSDLATTGTVKEYVVHLVAGASGSFLLYVDGSTITGGDAAFSGTDMKTVRLSGPDNAGGFTTQFSEVILGDSDNGLVGSIVETEAPTADGTDTGGTGTYADVDEAIFNDADNIVFAAAADRHSFTSAARTSTLDSVLGVSVAARMKCDVTGPQGAKFYLKIGGTRYYSSDFTLTNAFTGYQYTWAVNPATAAAWTTTDANAATLEWGIEAIA